VSNNYANINEIVAKIKKEFTNENNDSEIQIYYVENKKKIIISGTDIDEINGVAKMLEENLKGQETSNQMIQCDQLVYEKLIKDELFFKNFEKVKIFNKFNNNRTIRIIGEKQKVDDAKMQIELKCNELDKEIETLPFELSNSEFIYISTQALNEVKQIEKNTNSIIVESPYVKYASFTYNKTNVILCHGDILKLNVDAYVNPVNERMQANSGLAKLMIDKAGDKVNEKCKIYIQKNCKLSEGNVFVTSSGKLGCKKNSLIIHASGPVWRGGYSNESSKLASLVRLSFKEAIYNKCKSIAIPPVSCGIFGYEPRQATEITTENIIEFLKENNDNSLETVLLISNELEKVRIWAKSLFLVCTRSCLEIQISSSLLKHESRWYWLDDENNWKAYLEKYSDFIQENFERKKLTFDMNIDGKSYFIDLSKSDGYKQVNKKTNHVHQVTNVMPNETFYQWYWLDDKKNKSPYSLEHSKLIEQGYKKKKSFSMIIKKHVNDIDCEYIIDFSNNIFLDGSKVDAVQINKETFFKRRMFREELLKNIEPNIEENVLKNKQLGHIIFITTFSENKHKVVQALRKIINNAKKREVLPVIDELTMEEMNRIMDENDVKIHIESEKLIVNGMKDNVDKVKNEFLTMIVNKSNKSKINLPDTWAEMEHSENLKLIEIQKSSSEFRNIYKEISKSVTDFEILANKVEENEKFLFHGTNETSPYTIYDDLVGFDMRFSRKGMWGHGIYFAVNASYSKLGYSYKNKSEGTHSIFYARVALGDYTEQPSRPWCLPPLKPNSKLRYDSIKGHTKGSDIFILYENGRAYPEYLITFSK
ncbi:unnamed protein product, partial [Brachionus calyciflorus]